MEDRRWEIGDGRSDMEDGEMGGWEDGIWKMGWEGNNERHEKHGMGVRGGEAG